MTDKRKPLQFRVLTEEEYKALDVDPREEAWAVAALDLLSWAGEQADRWECYIGGAE